MLVDDADEKEIFFMALQEVDESIHCIFANDGGDAVEKLKADPSFLPHYIFLDINMPRMNGVEYLKK